MFVCVEVLRPSLPSGVMLSEFNLPKYTFTGQAKSSKRLPSIKKDKVLFLLFRHLLFSEENGKY